jgi:hypothetical protein
MWIFIADLTDYTDPDVNDRYFRKNIYTTKVVSKMHYDLVFNNFTDLGYKFEVWKVDELTHRSENCDPIGGIRTNV